ncbi:MAG: hypothetical protein ACI392_06750 [Paludibacteraceae bacterium]
MPGLKRNEGVFSVAARPLAMEVLLSLAGYLPRRNDTLRIANAQLRYYMHVSEPDSLSDEEWAMRLKELEWIRRKEAETNKG